MAPIDRERECPRCDSAELGEWDPVLHVYVCPTCSATWRRPPGRLVPTVRARRLPGIERGLSLDNEWPRPLGDRGKR